MIAHGGCGKCSMIEKAQFAAAARVHSIRVIVGAASVLMAFCSCSRQPVLQPSGALHQERIETNSPATALDREAMELAKRYYSEHASQCGTSSYSEKTESNGVAIASEYSDISWSREVETLSESDRLNGVEWRGSFEIVPKRYRTRMRNLHSPAGNTTWGQWSENYKGMAGGWMIGRVIQVTRGKSTWTVTGDLDGAKPLPCSAGDNHDGDRLGAL